MECTDRGGDANEGFSISMMSEYFLFKGMISEGNG